MILHGKFTRCFACCRKIWLENATLTLCPGCGMPWCGCDAKCACGRRP